MNRAEPNLIGREGTTVLGKYQSIAFTERARQDIQLTSEVVEIDYDAFSISFLRFEPAKTINPKSPNPR